MIGQYGKVITAGLPKARDPKRVIVLGAGIAGLVAAYELKRAGHIPIVIEGRQRVGGRIYTMRDPFTDGLHAEAGAMRIPEAHDLTWAYVQKFGLKVIPFTMSNPEGYCYMYGQRRRIREVYEDVSCLEFECAEHETGKHPSDLFEESIRPIAEKLEAEGDAAWPDIVAQYDQFSAREFLEANHWSEGAIEMYGLLANQESRMNASFIELLLAEMGHSFKDMWQIDGGTDLLPRAFLPELQGDIRFGARITAIDQSDTDVTVHYRVLGERASVTGDYAVCTLPFSVLRHIETITPFSKGKQRAIRQLIYDASAKIFLQFRRRFWETDDGIVGGGSVTDLAVRNMYYPEHGRTTGRGVMLASYTWGEDAQRWGSLSPQERVQQALENVAVIHPQALEEFEVGSSWMWHDDEFACGAFALFDPGQQTQLHQHIIAPEGRIHFAGEHASLVHRWIQGSIESALRATSEITEQIAAGV